MIKLLAFILLAFSSNLAFGFDGNQYVMKDGKLFFKPYRIDIATAGGGPYYCESVEQKELIADTLRGKHDFFISTITQPTSEISVTTNSTINSINDLDFIINNSTYSKKYLIDQVLKLDTLILNYTDLKIRYPQFTNFLNKKIIQVQGQLDALVNYYQSLP